MDFSRLDRNRVLVGGTASILLIVSILFLPWYTLDHNPARNRGEAFICGVGDYSCTGFQTFPILRWLLLAGALSPLILAWIIVRGHRLSWAPGEMTMVIGFAMMVLMALVTTCMTTPLLGLVLGRAPSVAAVGAIASSA